MRHVLLLCAFSFSFISATGAQFPPCDDTVYADVYGDTVILHHDNAEHNCCPVIVYTLSQEDSILNAIEADTLYGCDCMCCIDISATITDLSPGRYLIRVWNWDQSLLHGEVWVTIGSGAGIGPHLSEVIQTDCLQPVGCGDINCDGYYFTITDLMSWMNYFSYLYTECENMGCDTTWLECATPQSDINSDWVSLDRIRSYAFSGIFALWLATVRHD